MKKLGIYSFYALLIGGLLSCSERSPFSINAEGVGIATSGAFMGSGIFSDLDAFPLGGQEAGALPDPMRPGIPVSPVPSWPKFPRRDYIHQEIIKNTVELTLGVNQPLGSAVEIGGSVKVEAVWSTIISTIIMANNDTKKGETVFRSEGSGSKYEKVFLNYWEGRDMVVLCSLASTYEIADHFQGKLKIFSNGLEAVHSVKEVSSVTQYSKFRRPEVGETDENAVESCKDELFDKVGRESVEQDLNAGLRKTFLSDKYSQCFVDDECGKFYRTRLSIWQYGTRARCLPTSQAVNDKGDKPLVCQLRGKEGMACSLFDKDTGDRLTRGLFEIPCDKKAGLVCKQTKPSGWFSYAEAECVKKENN